MAGIVFSPLMPKRHRAALAACLTATTVLSAAAAPACAADWLGEPPLRGTLLGSPVRWDGIYFGGSMGVGNSDTDFGNSAHDLIAYMLRNTTLQDEQHPEDWTALGSQIGHLTTYGGFLGYNVQWGDLVLGAEGAYSRVTGDPTTASDSMTRIVTLSTGTDTVTINASSSFQLKDYATIRGRAGYAFGQFLPYAYLGLAVGRFDYSTTVSLTVTGTDNYSNTDFDGKDGAIVAGLDAGLGIDVALAPNIFLRGEWEFMAFAEVSGIRYNTNIARAGLGVKF